MRFLLPLLAFVLLPHTALAYDPASPESAASLYTFAWPLGEGMLKPRGSSTKGGAVTMDPEPSAQWNRLHEIGISNLERDRRAILAMAGPYRVSFDFLEVARFDPEAKADAPYQSWGTEYVFVSEDQENFIALQHILVMRIAQKDGTESEPMVTRHWRQEWRYEANDMLVYDGLNAWSLRKVPEEFRRGTWTQSVSQVDDSPRYSAVGRWQHTDSFSTWIGNDTWRPLPRREWSVRKDYQVLLGTNRHTILANGWIQEENNLKLVLDESGQVPQASPYRAREYGVARYERIKDFDWTAGREYFEKTEPFWAQVRAAWRSLSQNGGFKLAKPVDQGQLFIPFFEYAERLAEGEPFVVDDARTFVDETLRKNYLSKSGKSDQNASLAR